jgi:uncharacterized protein YjiS (DUF1127 family)
MPFEFNSFPLEDSDPRPLSQAVEPTSTADRPIGSLSPRRGLGHLIAALADRWIAAEARRRDAERLATMPDYLLRDIGLTRNAVRGEPTVRALQFVTR